MMQWLSKIWPNAVCVFLLLFLAFALAAPHPLSIVLLVASLIYVLFVTVSWAYRTRLDVKTPILAKVVLIVSMVLQSISTTFNALASNLERTSNTDEWTRVHPNQMVWSHYDALETLFGRAGGMVFLFALALYLILPKVQLRFATRV